MNPESLPMPPIVSFDQTTRVAILSDTHGHVCPNVLAVVGGCDLAVHAGDISSARVLQQLREVTGRVYAVRGNNDVPGLWAGDELDVLAGLPAVAEVGLPGGRLVVEHGHVHGPLSPDLASLRSTHPRARAIVYGHTHKLLIDQSAEPWVLNPGAAGRIRNQGGPSCLVLHAAKASWRVEEFKFHDSGPIGT
jgi:putative phosphoesterase